MGVLLAFRKLPPILYGIGTLLMTLLCWLHCGQVGISTFSCPTVTWAFSKNPKSTPNPGTSRATSDRGMLTSLLCHEEKMTPLVVVNEVLVKFQSANGFSEKQVDLGIPNLLRHNAGLQIKPRCQGWSPSPNGLPRDCRVHEIHVISCAIVAGGAVTA